LPPHRSSTKPPPGQNPRSTLCVFAHCGAAADALLAELFAGYRQAPPTAAPQPRIGLLNYAYDNSHLTGMDPALLWPGRLIAHRDFDLLTVEEARRLAAALKLPASVVDRISLAELSSGSVEEKSTHPRSLTTASHRSMGFHTILHQT
jgi:hypothetical protein